MSDRCPQGGFDRTLVSGYLDGELTQGDAQRVRLHLEDCADCRALHERLSTLRGATMTTPFATPTDDQWDERPRSPWARWTRLAGWIVAGAWVLAILALLVWQPDEPAPWHERILVFGFWGGAGLLLLSVLLDRLRDLPGDRYRGVRK